MLSSMSLTLHLSMPGEGADEENNIIDVDCLPYINNVRRVVVAVLLALDYLMVEGPWFFLLLLTCK